MTNQLLITQTLDATDAPEFSPETESSRASVRESNILVLDDGSMLSLDYASGIAAVFQGLSGSFPFPMLEYQARHIGTDGSLISETVLMTHVESGTDITRPSPFLQFQLDANGNPYIYANMDRLLGFRLGDDSYGSEINIFSISSTGEVSDPVDPRAEFSRIGTDMPLSDGTSVRLAFPQQDLFFDSWDFALEMQIFDADGEPIGDAVSPAGGLPRGNTHGARVDEDGNIVILRSSPSARLIEYVVDTSGALISNALVYAPKDDPSAHQISNDSSRVFRPDGGYVALSGSILQNYTADGRPDGLAIDLGYPSGSSMSQMALGKGGDFWVRWNSRTPDSTDQEFTGGYAAFEIIIPRSLTDEADLEFLSSPEAVDGGAGNDVILGSDGVDRLLGSDGDDVLMGGAGDDLMRGDAGNDMLIGGDGAADTAFYQGGWQDYDVWAEDELVYISGTGAASGDGTDRLSGIERLVFSDMDVEVSDFVTQFGTAFSGTDADDTFYGTSGNNLLSGLAGDDTLNGRDGVDTLYGGDGNDVLTGGRSPDDLHDEIHGQAGNDILRGGYGNDLVLGGDGNDTIDGGRGVDTVAGGTGNDAVGGGSTSDVVFGGAGDDFLNGGYGHDRLNGGSGADRFFHLGTDSHGTDWIQDYSAADGDVLMYAGTATAADFIVQRATTAGAGSADIAEIFVTHRGTGNLLWALVDGDAQENLQMLAAGQTFDIL